MVEPMKADTPSASRLGARTVRVLRGVCASAGLLLVLAAVLADTAGPGRGGFGQTQVLLTGSGLALLVAALLGRRTGRVWVSLVVIVANTLLAVVFAEIAAGAILTLWPGPQGAVTKPRSRYRPQAHSFYADKSWAVEYWSEQGRIGDRQRYSPWTIWRSGPFEGRYITIDEDGFRVTPGADCRPGSYRVFVLGGSAAWGTGSPDSATIPAFLERRLSAAGRPVCVRNLAQTAFVSTQDLLELLKALQQGDVPDLVVFYDGFNDVYSASIYHDATVHLGWDGIARTYETRQTTEGERALAFVKGLRLYELARRLHAGRTTTATAAPRTLRPSTDSLADAVVAAWLVNYTTARSLARDYGFRLAWFWQPALLASHKPMTAEERRIARLAVGTRNLTRAVYDRIEDLAPTLPDFHYLGNVLDDDSASLYIDFVHVTPDANRRIADCVVSLLTFPPD